MRGITLTCIVAALLGGCANTDRPLRDLRAAGGGPDEFAVIPQNPLVIPAQKTLPVPTPGGGNLADPNPNAQAIATLGGRSAAQRVGGVPASDTALITQAGRYGVDPNIRAELAAADQAFRERRSRVNIFNPLGRDRYFPAYAGQALDANAERARLAAAGINVPTPRPITRGDVAAPPPSQIVVSAPTVQDIPEAEAAPRSGGGLTGIFGNRQPGEECVFTTAGQGNELRRVCTPIDATE